MAAPRQTLLDRALSYFAPTAGLRRAMARNALAKVRAYEGASVKDGWIPRRSGASANADHAADGAMLRHRARSLVQNNPYAAKALSCLVANVIGEGILPASRAVDEKTRKTLDALWQAWTAQADADGGTDFHGLEAQAYRAMEQDGEVLIRLRTRRPEDGLAVPLQIQVLEIDYLDSTKNAATSAAGGPIVSGVEFDKLGRVAANWLYDAHPGDGYRAGGMISLQSKRYSADKIIHLFAPDRPGQARGISRFAPVIARLRDLAIYEDAELARKQNEALLSVFVSGDGADFAIPGAGESSAMATSKASQFGDLGSLRPGAILATNGQNVTVAEPKAAPGYADYLRMQLYAVAAGTGVTYEMLTGDLSQVNFSSARMGMMEFRRSAEQRQWHVMVPRLLTRVWAAFVDAAVLAGKVRAADYAVEWSTPKWDYVNPIQDVKADLAEVAGGLGSLSEKLRKRGYQAEVVFTEMGKDFELLKKTGALDMILAATGKTAAPEPVEPDDPPDNAAKAKRDESEMQHRQAMETMAAGISALAVREHRTEIHNHVAPPSVHVAPEFRVDAHLPAQPAPVVEVRNEIIEREQAPAVVHITNEITVPDQPAPVVNNEVVMPSRMEMSVVSMPDRETTTTVSRDSAGNIKTSTQIEKDAE